MISITELHKCSLGRILGAIRLHKQWSLQDIAAKIGIHRATLAAWETSSPFILQLRTYYPIQLTFETNEIRLKILPEWFTALDVPVDQRDWFLFNAYRADYYIYLQPFGLSEEATRLLCTTMALNRQKDIYITATPFSPGNVGLSGDILSEIPRLPTLMHHLDISELM